MKFCVLYQQTSHNAQSPVRVVEQATGRGVSWINRYLDREYVRRLANTTLCTYAYNLLHLFAGGRVFTTPATLGKVTLASPRSWTMCASSPANSRGLPLPPSMTASPLPIAPSAMSSPMLPARSPAAFIMCSCSASPWALVGRGWP